MKNRTDSHLRALRHATRFAAIIMTPLTISLAACGAGMPQAEDPESTGDDASASATDNPTGNASEGDSLFKKADPTVGVTIKDDSKKQDSPCGGADIPDLLAVLSQDSCVVKNPNPNASPLDPAGRLDIQATSETTRVLPGAIEKITLRFHNKGKTPLPLDFTVDPEPHFDFEVYTEKGKRVDRPSGDEPALPSEVANAPEPDKGIARVTLAPGGTAKLTLPFLAVKYKWVSKERAKGAVPGRGYPREPAGPLSKGKYVVRVITPLADVSEGGDHEVSQPRVAIEVHP